MDKHQIVRVRNGFYVIVPVEYLKQGILPSLWFIDDLMTFLNRPYYVSLLSAAAIHGAGHQQPQWLQIMIDQPSIRPIQVKSVGIQFITKKGFSLEGHNKRMTETGYINVANPVQTAVDLIQFERHVGSFIRLLEVLEELNELFNTSDIEQVFKNNIPVSVLQRFGFLCENILNNRDIVNILLNYLKDKRIYPVVLSKAESRVGSIDKKWQIILNTRLDNIE